MLSTSFNSAIILLIKLRSYVGFEKQYKIYKPLESFRKRKFLKETLKLFSKQRYALDLVKQVLKNTKYFR